MRQLPVMIGKNPTITGRVLPIIFEHLAGDIPDIISLSIPELQRVRWCICTLDAALPLPPTRHTYQAAIELLNHWNDFYRWIDRILGELIEPGDDMHRDLLLPMARLVTATLYITTRKSVSHDIQSQLSANQGTICVSTRNLIYLFRKRLIYDDYDMAVIARTIYTMTSWNDPSSDDFIIAMGAVIRNTPDAIPIIVDTIRRFPQKVRQKMKPGRNVATIASAVLVLPYCIAQSMLDPGRDDVVDDLRGALLGANIIYYIVKLLTFITAHVEPMSELNEAQFRCTNLILGFMYRSRRDLILADALRAGVLPTLARISLRVSEHNFINWEEIVKSIDTFLTKVAEISARPPVLKVALTSFQDLGRPPQLLYSSHPAPEIRHIQGRWDGVKDAITLLGEQYIVFKATWTEPCAGPEV